jgi:hypothetical protein
MRENLQFKLAIENRIESCEFAPNTMLTSDLVKKYEQEKAKEIAKIEAEYADKIKEAKVIESAKEDLNKLVAKYDFKTTKQFLTALGFIREESAQAPAESSEGKKRAKVTDEMKKEIVELLKEKKTANEIAEKFGISAGTVNNIKKEAGLSKARK